MSDAIVAERPPGVVVTESAAKRIAWLMQQESTPNLADVLSEIEGRPKSPPEPGQVDTDDALGAYLREIERGQLTTTGAKR